VTNAKKKLLTAMRVQPDVHVKNEGDNFTEPLKDATVRQAMDWLRKKI
jgi:hypothetical protein